MEYPSLFVCLMGMGTVFFGLICLIVLTMVMGKIVGGHGAASPGPGPVAAPPAPAAGPHPQELGGAVSAPTSRASGSYP